MRTGRCNAQEALAARGPQRPSSTRTVARVVPRGASATNLISHLGRSFFALPMHLTTLPFLRLQRGQCLHLWDIGKRKPAEVLTVRRVRHITFASSWSPARTGNEHGAQLPEHPASMGLSGHNDLCINGSAKGREVAWPITARSS